MRHNGHLMVLIIDFTTPLRVQPFISRDEKKNIGSLFFTWDAFVMKQSLLTTPQDGTAQDAIKIAYRCYGPYI